jgi:hypothetical protein
MRKAIAMSFVLALLSACSLAGWYPRALYGYTDEEIGNAIIEIREQEAAGQISPEEADRQTRLWLDRIQPCGDCRPKTVLYPVDQYGNRVPGNGYVVDKR